MLAQHWGVSLQMYGWTLQDEFEEYFLYWTAARIAARNRCTGVALIRYMVPKGNGWRLCPRMQQEQHKQL